MEIKVGSKIPRTGIGMAPQAIHTGQIKTAPILVTSKIGMEDKLSNLDKIDRIIPDKKIEITKDNFLAILKECAQDLMVPRKLLVDGNEETVILLDSFENLIFTFNKDITFINKVFNLPTNTTLDDFLSNFLYVNIDTYSYNLFNAVPEMLPIVSTETISPYKLLLTIH